jgi:hypothetical protein
LVSAAYVADDLGVTKTIAERLVTVLQALAGRYSLDPYDRALMAGAARLSGRSTAEADALAGHDSDPFSFASPFEPVLGRGPACVRPSVFVGTPANDVNAWLLDALPDLGESP